MGKIILFPNPKEKIQAETPGSKMGAIHDIGTPILRRRLQDLTQEPHTDEQILKICDLILAQNPEDTKALMHKADYFFHHHKLQECSETLVKLIEKQDQEPSIIHSASHMLGNVYKLMGDFEKGLHYLEIAEKFDPQNPDILLRKAICLANLNRVEEAIDHFNRSRNTADQELKQEAKSAIQKQKPDFGVIPFPSKNPTPTL